MMKKKLNVSRKSVSLMTLLFGLAATAMVFLAAVKFPDSARTFSGLQIITGVLVFQTGPLLYAEIPFTVLALVAFLLPLIAGLIGVIKPKYFIITIGLFVLAALLFFLIPQYTHINATIGDVTNVLDTQFDLGIGAILAGVLSILGAVFGSLSFFTKTK